jgi:winged helix-turn helix protein
MRATAGFETHQAAGQPGEDLQDLGPGQSPLQNRLPAPIDTMHLEHALRDVESNGSNLHVRISPAFVIGHELHNAPRFVLREASISLCLARQIVLLTSDGLGTVEIMRRTGKSKTAVWRWQERFMTAGVDGLLRDKTRRRAFRRCAVRSSTASWR